MFPGRRSVAVAALIASAGCGGHSQSGDERAARKVVDRWLQAMSQRDDRTACDLLTTRLQRLIDLQLRQLGHGSAFKCRTYAAHWLFPPSPVGHAAARIEAVHLRGERGRAELSASADLETSVTLRKEQGQWRIDNYQ